MKVLGFAGSNSQKSINKKLVQYVLHKIEAAETELLDLNDYEVPIYSPERENQDGIPAKILDFAQKISTADLVVLSLAEHNGTYSTAFKNTYDWLSRIPGRKVWDETNLLLMATSPGGRGGQSVLEVASSRFPRDGAKIIATFSLPNFKDNYSADGLSSEFERQLTKILKDSAFSS